MKELIANNLQFVTENPIIGAVLVLAVILLGVGLSVTTNYVIHKN